MRAVAAVATAILLLAPFAKATAAQTAPLESPYFSCLGADVSRPVSKQAMRDLGTALHQQFDTTFALSEAEIQRNIDCLNNMTSDANGDVRSSATCATRMDYLFKTLPAQLTKYRETLALSRWNVMFRIYPSRESEIFNANLDKPQPFWMERIQPQPLIAVELVEVRRKFKQESDRVFVTVQREAEEAIRSESALLFQDTSNRQGASLMTERDWVFALNSGSTWAQIAEMRMGQLVFDVNKRRLVQQLVEHPLLAFIPTPGVSKQLLLAALLAMRENLHAEQLVVDDHFAISERVPRQSRARYQWSEASLYPLLDYVSVVESLLFSHRELCGAASQLFERYNNQQFWTSVFIAGATLGVVYILPPVLALTGMVMFEGYYIYSANNQRRRLMQSAFTSPKESMSLRSPEEAYLAADALYKEVVMSPLTIATVPALRLSRVLRMLR